MKKSFDLPHDFQVNTSIPKTPNEIATFFDKLSSDFLVVVWKELQTELASILIDTFENNYQKDIYEAFQKMKNKYFASYVLTFHHRYLIWKLKTPKFNKSKGFKLNDTNIDTFSKNGQSIDYILDEFIANFDSIYLSNYRESSIVWYIKGALLNFNAGVWNHEAREADENIINLFKESFKFQHDSVGLLTSWEDMSNMNTLQPAVHHYRNLEWNENKEIRVYTSIENYKSIQKAVWHIIWKENVIAINTDDNWSIDIWSLEKQIESDKNNEKYSPAILVWIVWTEKTWAIDDIDSLVKLKERHNLWLHISWFWWLAINCKKFEHLNNLLPKFDSLVIDFDFINIPWTSLSLVRDSEISKETFGIWWQNYLATNIDDWVHWWPPSKDSYWVELTLPSHRIFALEMALSNYYSEIIDIEKKEEYLWMKPDILLKLFNWWADKDINLSTNIEINKALFQVFKYNSTKVIHEALWKITNIEYARKVWNLHYFYLIQEVDKDYRKKVFEVYLSQIEKVSKSLNGTKNITKKYIAKVLGISNDTDWLMDIFSSDKLRNILNVTYLLKLFNKLKEINIDTDKIQEMLFSEDLFSPQKTNTNPNFFWWIMWAWLPASMIWHIIWEVLNINPESPKMKEIEDSVINTCKEIFHFPKDSAWVLTSWGSMANLTCLQPAVNHYRNKPENKGKQIRVYVSDQTHGSSEKAVAHIIWKKNVIRIPTEKNGHMNTEALKEQIKKDKEAWFVPAVIVWSIWTTNTWAIDDLKELIDIKETEGLWLHVDWAYWWPIIMTKEFEYLNELFHKFDSFALDFHKLMNITYSVWLSLVRNAEASKETFFWDFWPESKQPVYKATSIDFAMKNLWKQGFIDMIQKQIEMAKYLEEQIKNNCNDFLEIVVPREISIVCFTLKEKPWEDLEALNKRNRELMKNVNKAWKSAFTSTTINWKVVLRACVCNYQTREEHIHNLVWELIKYGKK